MKKLLLLIVAALVSFASCKKDNGPDLGTRPVEPSAEVSDFFEGNLEAFTWQALYENGIEPRTNACIVINSVEELPEFSPAFPVFDFETHTLVVGQVMTPVPGYRLLSQGIDTGPETMILNLVVKRPTGPSPGVVDELYYWGVYSKIDASTLEINAIFENANL